MIVKTSEDIGKLISKKRKECGMTQAECASLSGVGTRFISELERGKPTLEIDKVLNVACMMGLKILVENKQ